MNTKIFLAAVSHIKSAVVPYYKPHYLLESFMDLKGKSKKTDEYIKWCLKSDIFLLDSGAFTFINKKKKQDDSDKFDINSLNDYIDSYIKFINKWDIDYFFELDIDSIIGYENVLQIRQRIENETNKKCIPVWHINRGEDEFSKMCDEYDYVAIGGIASKEIPKKYHKKFSELCKIAHDKGCKIHGLGYLPISKLNDKSCPFDTVDGTGWQGHLRAQKFKIEDKKIIKLKDEELVDKQRTWKDNEKEGFGVWKQFSYIAEGDDEK